MLHYCSESQGQFKYRAKFGRSVASGDRFMSVSRSLTKLNIEGNSALVNKLQ
ncbi:hypothetical protein [Oscillatoria sp. HE19RPO]|uniref:hypothetical protein n=1 Tax=Oscillatoria sp. HE19RPO TaxID=2954806 RepID=UPI0020C3D70C|nr:hypothetical protein [Oscillatoria sp. HE19RPO]